MAAANPPESPFSLTVLGSAGSHTGPGRACSGHLVQTSTTNLLLDAGNGSTANLQRFVRFADVDAVFVTHRHVDHCVDLVGMFHALWFDPTFTGSVDLYAPAEVRETLTGLLSRDSALEFERVFRCHEVRGGDHVRVGDVDVDVFDARHPPPSVSYRVTSGGRVLAYSGDTALDDTLVECARDADLFLCEATWQGHASDFPDDLHLVAADAGRAATRAGARRLVLTHVAGGLDVEVSRTEAATTFDGPVAAADDLQTWTL